MIMDGRIADEEEKIVHDAIAKELAPAGKVT